MDKESLFIILFTAIVSPIIASVVARKFNKNRKK